MEKNRRDFILALLVLDIIYVLFEVALNSSVLELASGLVITQDKIEKIENFGRTLSGFGLGLAIFSMIKLPKSDRDKFTAFIFIMFISVPFMHGAQKAIIDEFIVETSTPESRANAELIVAYRDGMTMGLYNLGRGIPFIREDSKLPAELVMTSIFALSIFNEHSSNILRKNYDYFADIKISENGRYVDTLYPLYKKASDEYKLGLDINNQIKLSENASPEAVAKGILVFNQLKLKAGDIRKLIVSKEDELRDTIYRRADKIESKRYSGRSVGYYIRNSFENQMKDCERGILKRCEYAAWIAYKATRVGVFKSRHMSGKQAKAFFCKKGKCPRTTSELTSGILKHEAINSDFKLEIGFNMMRGRTSEAFMSDVDFFEQTNEELMDNIVRGYEYKYSLFKECKQDGYGATSSDIKQCIIKNIIASEAFDAKDKIDIPNYLSGQRMHSESSLLRHPDVKSTYEKLMGYIYFPVTSLNMSEAEFTRKLNSPSTLSQARRHIINMVSNNVNDFSDGGNREEEGKLYIKALYVPPIALFFSLLFTLVTVARLVSRMVMLLTHDNKHCKKYSFAVSAVLMLLIIIVPVFVIPSKFASDESIDRLELFRGEKFTGKQEYQVKWILSAQPIIYKIGEPIIRGFGLETDR